ncbi:hypothetical protein [Dyadobacter fanqingshengii]|uniref:Uncharacterized protein n=1 Tax=Dyadobacter fanqingshengii TaxID=2906443 RepID=A0A9X1P6C4_9BACT|nr:hypothetical protein [Dyadobacter fanqingshengii]MCF0039684.1 hypothetical protein [Dyadobacter fanqingshengii]USJ38551.1 hypothetical protein NFI81_12375 [Dyadobacter fanqingshengii]
MLQNTLLEKTPEFLIAFVTAVLGVGYPIILQAISRLDDQYGSMRVTNAFKKEPEMKMFRLVMTATLVSVGLYILNLSPEYDFLENSAFLLLIVFTTILIASYILLINKFIKYLSPEYLTNLFINRFVGDREEEQYYNILIDLLVNSLSKGRENVITSIYSFQYAEFKRIREESGEAPVSYPYTFYSSLYRVIVQISQRNSVLPSDIENGSIGGRLIFGSYHRHRLSDDTYKWLWNYLVIAIAHAQDRMVFKYWTTAYQYYQTSFVLVFDTPRVFDSDDQERFLEFHYALGGYLLFNERYQCLEKLFRYTISSPGTSEMLPKSMTDIFKWLSHYSDRGDLRSMAPLSYFFPEVEGINSGEIVNHWICKYLGILLLRQYTIQSSYTSNYVRFEPNLPATLYEMTVWLNQIPYWEKLLLDILENQNYMQAFRFSHITIDWCVQRNMVYPTDLLKKIKASLIQKIEETHRIQSVSKEQKRIFADSIKETLIPLVKSLTSLSGKKASNKETDINKRFIEGIRFVSDKYPYTDEGAGSTINRDLAPIRQVSSSLTIGFSEVISQMTTGVYHFSENQIADIVNKLHLSQQHLIVSFGMDQYVSELSQYENGFANGTIEGIDVLSSHPYLKEQIGRSLFILRKDSFPKIEFLTPFAEMIDKFGLQQVDEEVQVYYSVIDINDNIAVKEELEDQFPGQDFSKSVDVLINLTAELSWTKNVKCIAIQFPSHSNATGVKNNIEDLKEF